MSPRTETELLDAIVDLARLKRWSCHHDRPSRRAGSGWATAIQGHAGFPDLVLARNGVVLFRELKGFQGRLSAEQRDWGKQLGAAFAVWTPADWDLIVATLSAKATAA